MSPSPPGALSALAFALMLARCFWCALLGQLAQWPNGRCFPQKKTNGKWQVYQQQIVFNWCFERRFAVNGISLYSLKWECEIIMLLFVWDCIGVFDLPAIHECGGWCLSHTGSSNLIMMKPSRLHMPQDFIAFGNRCVDSRIAGASKPRLAECLVPIKTSRSIIAWLWDYTLELMVDPENMCEIGCLQHHSWQLMLVIWSVSSFLQVGWLKRASRV